MSILEPESPELFSATPLVTYSRRHGGLFARLLAKVAPRFLKDPLLVAVPSSLAAWPTGAAELFGIARTLRQKGIFDEWREMPSLPDEPPLFAFESALKKEGLSNGADPHDKNAALTRMLAEAYERSRLRNVDLEKSYATATGTAREMESRGLVLPPASFTGWSDTQLENVPALAGRDVATFTWVKLPTLSAGAAWLPLSSVSARFEATLTNGGVRREPLVRPLTSTGLATGQSLEEATLRGVLEIIERDAFMVAYLNRLGGHELNLDTIASGEEKCASIIGTIERFSLRLRLVRLPSEFPVHVILAVVEDSSNEGPAIVVGGKASFSREEAIIGAIAEALFDRRMYRAAHLGERVLPDNPRAFTTEDRIAYWGRKSHARELDFLYEKSSEPLTPPVPSPTSAQSALNILTKALAGGGFSACVADLTDDVGRKIGWHTVLSIIPGLHPMHLDEGLPYKGGKRLANAPALMGQTPDSDTNPIPHPYP